MEVEGMLMFGLINNIYFLPDGICWKFIFEAIVPPQYLL